MSEAKAQRLIDSTIERWFDDTVDIDWSSSVSDDYRYMPPQMVSVYGTEFWQNLTEQQKNRLGRFEIASIMSIGIWLEMVLMGMLIRHLYPLDHRLNHFRYGLAEIGDETRHSTMFSKASEKFSGKRLWVPRVVSFLGKLVMMTASGPSAFAVALIAEETTECYQKSVALDPKCDPTARSVMRIHLIEEARHISYARDAISEMVVGMNPLIKAYHEIYIAICAIVVINNLHDKQIFHHAGLDQNEGLAALKTSSNYRRIKREISSKVLDFLEDQGLISWKTRWLYKRNGMR